MVLGEGKLALIGNETSVVAVRLTKSLCCVVQDVPQFGVCLIFPRVMRVVCFRRKTAEGKGVSVTPSVLYHNHHTVTLTPG